MPQRFLQKHIFIGFVILLSGCNYDKRELPEPAIPVDTIIVSDCDTSAVITYTNFVKSMLETNCTFPDCHGSNAPDGFIYTTYPGIKAKVDSGTFQLRVLDLMDMPLDDSPGPDTLDACTLLKLQEWVNDGAPE